MNGHSKTATIVFALLVGATFLSACSCSAGWLASAWWYRPEPAPDLQPQIFHNAEDLHNAIGTRILKGSK